MIFSPIYGNRIATIIKYNIIFLNCAVITISVAVNFIKKAIDSKEIITMNPTTSGTILANILRRNIKSWLGLRRLSKNDLSIYFLNFTPKLTGRLALEHKV